MTWLAKIIKEEKEAKEKAEEEIKKLAQAYALPQQYPRLPKNEILGKKECDECKNFHLFPDSQLVLQYSNHEFIHINILFDSGLTQDKCLICQREGDKHVQCGCPCHRPRERFIYKDLGNRKFFRTHWTEHDLISEGKSIFEKARKRND